MTGEEPTGQRYSHVYLHRGVPTKDSERFRVRMSQTLAVLPRQLPSKLGQTLQRELGVQVVGTGGGLMRFVQECATRDLLDTVTVVWRFLNDERYLNRATDWLDFARRALAEENLGYRIDDNGGVHPLVDVEFEAQRVAVIQVLSAERYRATLEAFEGAHEALERDPPDTKEAVRDVFGAVENLFKLMAGGRSPNLTGGEIKKHLAAMLDQHYADNSARRAAGRMMDSLCDWVDGAHWYRHEPGQPDPAPPPPHLCVMIMSTGAGYLRWLAEMDKALNS